MNINPTHSWDIFEKYVNSNAEGRDKREKWLRHFRPRVIHVAVCSHLLSIMRLSQYRFTNLAKSDRGENHGCMCYIFRTRMIN